MRRLTFLFTILVIFSLLAGCSLLPLGQNANILLAESFDGKASEMDQYVKDTGSAGVQADEFQIRVLAPNYMQWSLVNLSFTDAVVEVAARKAGGPDDNIYGVICRFKDDLNFYFMVVSSDGYYGIGRMLNGQRTLLTGDQLTPTAAVGQGNAVNLIRAECSGPTLSLEVNGTQLAKVSDINLTEGKSGLLAGDFTDSGVDIRFDNLKITKPRS